MDNRIATLHEFGHAKQWMERPMLFDQQPKIPSKNSADAEQRRLRSDVKPQRAGQFRTEVREKALKLGGAERDARLGSTRAGFAAQVADKASKLWENKGDGDVSFLRSQVEREEFEVELKAGPQWGRAIEMDNMSRHEWPICIELGLPLRQNYRDINATSDGQPSLTSMIRQKGAAAEARAQEAMLAKAAELTKLQGPAGSQVCPLCGKSLPSAAKLRGHRTFECPKR